MHHVCLVNHITRLWNAPLAQEKLKGTGKDRLEPLLGLQDVQSGEHFGLIASNYTFSFKGLLEIKEECKEDEFDLGSFDHSGATDLAQTLNIDPQLLKLPSKNHSTTAILPNPPLSQDVTMLHDTPESARVNATSVLTKRKSIQSNGFCQSNDRPDTIKRPRQEAIVSLAKKYSVEKADQFVLAISVLTWILILPHQAREQPTSFRTISKGEPAPPACQQLRHPPTFSTCLWAPNSKGLPNHSGCSPSPRKWMFDHSTSPVMWSSTCSWRCVLSGSGHRSG